MKKEWNFLQCTHSLQGNKNSCFKETKCCQEVRTHFMRSICFFDNLNKTIIHFYRSHGSLVGKGSNFITEGLQIWGSN